MQTKTQAALTALVLAFKEMFNITRNTLQTPPYIAEQELADKQKQIDDLNLQLQQQDELDQQTADEITAFTAEIKAFLAELAPVNPETPAITEEPSTVPDTDITDIPEEEEEQA
jgi:hypothetical protein